jgi:hypothetical protein
MIKVHFRKKTLLGSTVTHAVAFKHLGSVFFTREDLRGIVLGVVNCGELW